MKRGAVIWSISFVVVALLLASFAFADVIPPGMRYLPRCVTIHNSYPDVAIVGDVTGPGSSERPVDRFVVTDACLDKGYKFNTLKLYWTASSYLAGKNVSAINVAKDDNLHFITGDINPSGTYVSPLTMALSEDIRYDVVKQGDGYTLVKEGEGTPDNGAQPSQNTAPRSFWQSIACWFSWIFGSAC